MAFSLASALSKPFLLPIGEKARMRGCGFGSPLHRPSARASCFALPSPSMASSPGGRGGAVSQVVGRLWLVCWQQYCRSHSFSPVGEKAGMMGLDPDPLTPALSRRERESRVTGSWLFSACSLASALSKPFLLPSGEKARMRGLDPDPLTPALSRRERGSSVTGSWLFSACSLASALSKPFLLPSGEKARMRGI